MPPRLKRSDTSSAAASRLDKPLAVALATVLVVYTAVTIFAYTKVSAAANHGGVSSSRVEIHPMATRVQTEKSAAVVAVGNNNKDYAHGPSKRISSIEELQRTFPIHVGNDTQVVDHPGLVLSNHPDNIPADLPRHLTVPQFFDQSHAYVYGNTGSIRDSLGNHGQRLMTVEEAASIGSKITVSDGSVQETIYCSIASYRDPECTGSVEDLYARAKYPERIRVAILDQRSSDDSRCSDPPEPCEKNPEQALCKYRHLMDVYEMDARLAVGPVFARHLAHRHYRGEYFAMQIDSHVRFTADWDEDIANQWKSAKNEMAVLTTYLSDIHGSIDPETYQNTHYGRPIMCVSDYEGAGQYKHLRHGQQPEGPAGIQGQPTLHPFWAAGFSFARGHFVIQVPYDQYLPMVFQGEEISIGLRGFTYGYDYYAAENSVCFHMYAIKENKERRKKVPLFWENTRTYQGVGMRAMKRLNSIIGMGQYPESEWQQDEQEKYGLGQVRKAEKFFKTFGIHVETQQVEHHLCRFVGKPMMKEFLPKLRENRMGIDYDQIDYVFVDPAPGAKK